MCWIHNEFWKYMLYLIKSLNELPELSDDKHAEENAVSALHAFEESVCSF